jgi:hypothetical protein
VVDLRRLLDVGGWYRSGVVKKWNKSEEEEEEVEKERERETTVGISVQWAAMNRSRKGRTEERWEKHVPV